MTVAVCRIGARTPIGLHSAAAAAAHRASVSGFIEHPFMIDKRGEAMVVAMDPAMLEEHTAADRMGVLAESAIDEALTELPAAVTEISLLLALPTARPGWQEHEWDRLRRRVEARLQRFCRLGETLTFVNDHAAGALALAEAHRRVSADKRKFCLVVGTDSLIAAETLEWLDAEGRLATEKNPFGLIPGEAAAAVLVASFPNRSDRKLVALAGLRDFAHSTEPTHERADSPNVGEGLSNAVALATEGLFHSGRRVDHLIADLTGEPARANEFGYSLARHGRRFQEDTTFEVLANRVGDSGAAFCVLATILAAVGVGKGYVPGPFVLISSSSPTGIRAAVLLHLAGPSAEET